MPACAAVNIAAILPRAPWPAGAGVPARRREWCVLAPAESGCSRHPRRMLRAACLSQTASAQRPSASTAATLSRPTRRSRGFHPPERRSAGDCRIRHGDADAAALNGVRILPVIARDDQQSSPTCCRRPLSICARPRRPSRRRSGERTTRRSRRRIAVVCRKAFRSGDASAGRGRCDRPSATGWPQGRARRARICGSIFSDANSRAARRRVAVDDGAIAAIERLRRGDIAAVALFGSAPIRASQGWPATAVACISSALHGTRDWARRICRRPCGGRLSEPGCGRASGSRRFLSAILVTAQPSASDARGASGRLRRSFFSRLPDIQRQSRNPAWRDVNLGARRAGRGWRPLRTGSTASVAMRCG